MNKPMFSFITALRRARRVLLAAHVTPDGDAAGSAVALAIIVQSLGGQARVCLPGGMPPSLSWFKSPAPVLAGLNELGIWIPDLLVFADCGDAHRAGPELAALFLGQLPPGWDGLVTANIDHHQGNPLFADINWVEPDRAATGELVGLMAEELGLPLSGALGEALYLALATDTGNFTYDNTSADSLALASRIVAAGFDVAAFTDANENNWSLERMHLWGRLMSGISLHAGGAVACCMVPLSYLEELGLARDDLEGFASWLRRIRGVRVALFIREDAAGLCKISLRSMGDFDVRAVAALFGGGGHKSAAGAEVALTPPEAARTLLAEIERRL
ncbi:bifunctional oligoribonuclease/PAP phosphatase NrnA [Desulfovibrio sp. OttesenSCG-928-G11]|nr:bifunctional oligoribonuclease/PAP phosphatase NrnA [Desulfovibrio sp. OttesenSCG-928-G11]